jgi:uncharacterized protein HemY
MKKEIKLNQADIDAAIEIVKDSLRSKYPKSKIILFLREECAFTIKAAETFLKEIQMELK